jgi:hypothetical protein
LFVVAASGFFDVSRGLFELAVVFAVLDVFAAVFAVFAAPPPQPIIMIEKIRIVVNDINLDCI